MPIESSPSPIGLTGWLNGALPKSASESAPRVTVTLPTASTATLSRPAPMSMTSVGAPAMLYMSSSPFPPRTTMAGELEVAEEI
jgi:hypothetical protein